MLQLARIKAIVAQPEIGETYDWKSGKNISTVGAVVEFNARDGFNFIISEIKVERFRDPWWCIKSQERDNWLNNRL